MDNGSLTKPRHLGFNIYRWGDINRLLHFLNYRYIVDNRLIGSPHGFMSLTDH